MSQFIPKKSICILLLFLLPISTSFLFAQNVGINSTGALPDPTAMLDISSTTSGMLVPRMTTVQRDAIVSPSTGLYIYNTTTNTFNVYAGDLWEVLGYANPREIVVTSLADLPTPVAGGITLDPTKLYTFYGIVNIGTNYININGAFIRGTATADGITSSVSGAILRSTDKDVILQDIIIMPASSNTQAFSLSDGTGLENCIMFSGTNVVDAVPSLGVGQISGFLNVVFINNNWTTTNGIKVTGTVKRFAYLSSLANDMPSGIAIEFLSTASVGNAAIHQSIFTDVGTAFKVNAGAVIGSGKMLANDLLNVTTPLNGLTSYTPEWEMFMNTDIPNSRSYGYLYMNDNVSATDIITTNVYAKVAGTTTSTSLQKFSSPASNRLTYIGKRNILARVFIAVSGESPTNGGSLSVTLAKNGTVITTPHGEISGMTNNQGFQITLDTEVSLVTNDYIEVFIANNVANTDYTIRHLQFRAVE